MPDHKLVPLAMFEELERKARAHDDYLEAMGRLRQENARVSLRALPTLHSSPHEKDVAFAAGYRSALTYLSNAIVDVGNERPVPHG